MDLLLKKPTIQLRLPTDLHLSDEQLFDLCQLNQELRIERTNLGELLIMSPASSDAGARNASLTGQLWLWNRTTGLGQVFDSSAGFIFANGAMRAPDAAWIRRERWEALPLAQRQKFAAISPDFVVKLKSPSDKLEDLQSKMQEYIENGVLLGWLIDPMQRQVWIYKSGTEAVTLENPHSLSDALLPGFELELNEIFA
jgi:Uma2 family endonuclease